MVAPPPPGGEVEVHLEVRCIDMVEYHNICTTYTIAMVKERLSTGTWYLANSSWL